MQPSSLHGRIALVTGASRRVGIGAAICRELATAGADVFFSHWGQYDQEMGYADPDGPAALLADLRGLGVRAEADAVDLSDPAAPEALLTAVERRLGPPTILVNNAGILRDNLLFRMTEDDWDSVVAVHLRGAFLMTRAVQVHQVEARWGRIVNLSSISALGNRGQTNYAAAKAGLQGFTKSLAIELGPFGITANAIAPGFVATEMTRATAERLGMTFEDFLAHVAKDIPVGRAGTPEDIAAAASFLASDEASFTSGQVLYVAGGPRA